MQWDKVAKPEIDFWCWKIVSGSSFCFRRLRCKQPVPLSEMPAYAAAGVAVAQFWQKVAQLPAATEELLAAHPDARPAVLSKECLEEARRLHAAAVAVSGMCVRSAEHPLWKAMLQLLQPDYSVPSPRQVGRELTALTEVIDRAVEECLASRGPWGLTCDGATSKGHILYVVTAENAQGDALTLKVKDAGYAKKDSKWVVNLLTEVAQQANFDSGAPCCFAQGVRSTCPSC